MFYLFFNCFPFISTLTPPPSPPPRKRPSDRTRNYMSAYHRHLPKPPRRLPPRRPPPRRPPPRMPPPRRPPPRRPPPRRPPPRRPPPRRPPPRRPPPRRPPPLHHKDLGLTLTPPFLHHLTPLSPSPSPLEGGGRLCQNSGGGGLGLGRAGGGGTVRETAVSL
jgi:hypothetical protein